MRVPYRKPGKYSQIKSDPLLTEGKLVELKNKLDRLKNFSQPRAIEEVKRLAELGDFSENAAYQMAKGKLRGINSRIIELGNLINEAIIINRDETIGTVQLGSIVTVEMRGKQMTYKILGSGETNPLKGIISHNSPIGSALMGHQVGETAVCKIRDDKVECRIIRID